MTDSIRRYQAMKDAIKAGPPPKEPTVEDVFPDDEMVPYEDFAQEVLLPRLTAPAPSDADEARQS